MLLRRIIDFLLETLMLGVRGPYGPFLVGVYILVLGLSVLLIGLVSQPPNFSVAIPRV